MSTARQWQQQALARRLADQSAPVQALLRARLEAAAAMLPAAPSVTSPAAEAVRTCTLAGVLAPTRWDALFQAAMAYWQVGDLPAARTTLLAAQSLQPNNPRIRAALAALSNP